MVDDCLAGLLRYSSFMLRALHGYVGFLRHMGETRRVLHSRLFVFVAITWYKFVRKQTLSLQFVKLIAWICFHFFIFICLCQPPLPHSRSHSKALASIPLFHHFHHIPTPESPRVADVGLP
jgi:hypothetical protein